MPQESDATSENYDRFIERVAETEVVWGLVSDFSGWAHCESDEDEAIEVILFWSDRADAEQHRKEEWADHVPTKIDFDEFIEAWLNGMSEDGLLAGPNWDADLNGFEVDPKELADRLLAENERIREGE